MDSVIERISVPSGLKQVTRRLIQGLRGLSREIDERATRIAQEERAKRVLEEYNTLRRFSQGEEITPIREDVSRERPLTQ